MKNQNTKQQFVENIHALINEITKSRTKDFHAVQEMVIRSIQMLAAKALIDNKKFPVTSS